MGQSKGSKKSKGRNKREFKYCHECVKFVFGCEIQRSKRVRSKQEKLGRNEMRRHGECRFECAGDWSSVVAREKSRHSGWNQFVNQFVYCIDCVCSSSLVRNEKLQAMYESECSKGERQAPRRVILVRGSENGRDV